MKGLHYEAVGACRTTGRCCEAWVRDPWPGWVTARSLALLDSTGQEVKSGVTALATALRQDNAILSAAKVSDNSHSNCREVFSLFHLQRVLWICILFGALVCL